MWKTAAVVLLEFESFEATLWWFGFGFGFGSLLPALLAKQDEDEKRPVSEGLTMVEVPRDEWVCREVSFGCTVFRGMVGVGNNLLERMYKEEVVQGQVFK